RIAPGCEYFGRCGGCQLQHTTPARQLELKREILLETLRRTGGVQWQGEVTPHGADPWGYRNRIRVQAVPGIGVGYYEHASRRVLPITRCPIASPALNGGLETLTAVPPDSRQEIELSVNNRDEGLEADAPLEFAVAGFRYRVSPGAFFQVNRFLAPDLVAAVTAAPRGRRALDLFSGVGLFALPLAHRFEQVEAIEQDPIAVEDLRVNATAQPIRVEQAAALEFLQHRDRQPLDLIVADPPRAGLGPQLAREIVAAAPQRVHLVSCDPATLGRDLQFLLAGGYAVESMDLFDLFPQTAHIETVVRLTRAKVLP
ncbi:MAG TPA: methyltransferase, partial [Terriglobales bacterium]|nr:methyltransferase [Terriglobales bacterium]